MAKSKKKSAVARPASTTPATVRNNKEEGTAGMGPGGLLGGNGGSRTPTPVNLRGGPPPRTEEACGSSSHSFSAKSYATSKKSYSLAEKLSRRGGRPLRP